MTWDSMESNWNEGQTKVRQRWGRLTDEDLRRINGQRTELVRVVAERYGIKNDQAEEQIEAFEQSDEFEGASAEEQQPSGRDASRETTGTSADDEDEALNQPRSGGMRSEP